MLVVLLSGSLAGDMLRGGEPRDTTGENLNTGDL